MLIEKAFSKLHRCFSFGTLVRVYDSPVPVAIEQLTVGMQLEGEDATPVTITKLATDVAQHMIRIEYQHGSHTVTRDHLVTLRCGMNPTVTWLDDRMLLQWWNAPLDAATGLPSLCSRSWRIDHAGRRCDRLVHYTTFVAARAAAHAWCELVVEKGRNGLTPNESDSLDPITLEAISNKFVEAAIHNEPIKIGHHLTVNICMTDADNKSRSYNHFVIVADSPDLTMNLMPALPPELYPYADQFARWWLATGDSRTGGLIRPLRLGDLIEVDARSLVPAPEQFIDCFTLPLARPMQPQQPPAVPVAIKRGSEPEEESAPPHQYDDSPNGHHSGSSSRVLRKIDSTRLQLADDNNSAEFETTYDDAPPLLLSATVAVAAAADSAGVSSSLDPHLHLELHAIRDFIHTKGIKCASLDGADQKAAEQADVADDSSHTPPAGDSSAMHSSNRSEVPPVTPALISAVHEWAASTGKGHLAGVEFFRGRVRPKEVRTLFTHLAHGGGKAGDLTQVHTDGKNKIDDSPPADVTHPGGIGESDEYVCAQFARSVKRKGTASTSPYSPSSFSSCPLELEFDYPPIQLIDHPKFIYMLHTPLHTESMLSADRKRAFTMRQIERAWTLLGIDPTLMERQVMISDMNPIAALTGIIDSSEDRFNDVCSLSMEFALECCADGGTIVVFGTPAYNRWIQTVDACPCVVDTVMHTNQLGCEEMHVTLDNGSTVRVLFAGHPSAWYLFTGIVATLAAAHSVTITPELNLHLAGCQEVTAITAVVPIAAATPFVRIEVTGTGRFVLADSVISHNCYQNIEGGWIDDALVDLAGGVADRIRWTDEKTKSALHDGSLWTTMLKYHQQGYLLGCGSPVGASDSEADATPWGIIQSHAYSILGLVAVDGIQLINVRNPWGRHEWTGQ